MKCFNHKLTIDANTAYDLLKEQYVYDISINLKNAILKYNTNKLNVDKLINGNYYFNQDDNVKRLHTNLTNMWSPSLYYLDSLE